MVEIEVLPDGCVKVRYGQQVGIVSSYHLVEPKIAQLKAADMQKPQGIAPGLTVGAAN
jgi:hypothetical protein